MFNNKMCLFYSDMSGLVFEIISASVCTCKVPVSPSFIGDLSGHFVPKQIYLSTLTLVQAFTSLSIKVDLCPVTYLQLLVKIKSGDNGPQIICLGKLGQITNSSSLIICRCTSAGKQMDPLEHTSTLCDHCFKSKFDWLLLLQLLT